MRFRRFFATSVLAMGIGMSLGTMSASAAPSSDTFASAGAIDIAGTRGSTSSDLAAGTRETGEPTVPGSNTAHTKWWRYIPTTTGFVRISTCSPTGMNPVPGMSLGLYTGSQVNLLTTVSQATNNCPAGYENAVLGPVAVTAGTYYYLQMGGANTIPVGDEDFNLTLDFNTSVPANDNWASATVISGALPQSFSANNGLATVEPNEPRSDDYNERQTLWYRWTATANGTISVNNCASVPESAMDSRISVFTGSSPVVATDMSFLDDNDNGCPGAASSMSRVYVPVTNGTSYWIKLSNNGAVNYGFPYSLQVKWVTTPENGVVPSMYPTRFKVGTTVNVDFDGVWGGFPAPTYARQWRLCNSAGAACANISGATGTSYTPVVGDIGKTLVLQVTATNSNGSTSASSAPSEVIDNTPANDLWANRTNLGTGSTISHPDDNNWATHSESGEPSIGVFPGRNSVWYRWTPATSGDYVINNCMGGPPGLDFLDLMIGIRTGTTSLATTSEVGSKDDGCGPSHPYRTSMLFTATAGTNYSIEVASKSVGLTGAYTLSIAPVGDPVVTVQPSITGTAAPGGTLNLDVGDWISPTNIVPEIHWLACNAAGASCVDTGFSGTAFAVQGSHSGGTIRANVILTNSYGTVTSSALSDVIAQDTDGDGVLDGDDDCPSVAGTKPNGCLPSDIVGAGIPAITGNLVTGQTLTSSTGTWTVNNDPLGYTLSYQWQRCNDATPGSCSDIGGATNSTYVLVAGDLAKTIRVAVTATNADDTAQQFSLNSGFVTAPPAPPANTTPPAISGSAIVGQTLSTSNGTWTPAGLGFTYEWLRCTDTTIGSCSVISSQTASTYTLAAADLGRYIRSRVTGTNVSGSLATASAASSIVLGDGDGDGVPDVDDDCPSEAGPRANGCQPSDIVGAGIPTIAGTPTVGQTLSSDEGSWTVLHDPLGYTATYQWQRCEDATPASCSNISGAVSNTYVLVGADFGKRMRVNVTATNADDTALQSSAITGTISQIPGSTVLPALSGTPRVTATLTTTQGTWEPIGVSLATNWLRCDDNVSPASCTVIPGQTGSTYTLVAADNGKYIRSLITGSNVAGSTPVESAPSAIVITDGDADGVADGSDTCPAEAGTKPNGCLPSDIVGTGVPTLSGTLNVGQTISSTTGSWIVLHDPLGYSLGYQWQRCDDGTAGSCTDIASATASTYALVAADYGKRVRVNVTATNADDSALQSSAISAAISQIPVNNTLPSFTGTTTQGFVLTANQGGWTPGDAMLTNAWLRCDDTTIGSCTAIGGQTGSTYTLVAADAAKYIRLRVTATTTAGPTVATSAASALIAADSDGDGVPNASDTCPSDAGARPNGCPPSDIVANGVPTLSGTLNVGQTVSSTTGSWTALYDPIGYSLGYQWQRCDDATVGSCTNIGGATSSTYVLAAADYGKRVRVSVTASNADDSAVQSSTISNVVSQVPSNTAAPAITGSATVGQILTASQGTWTPGDALLTNAWLRCDDTTIGSCSVIAGQSGTTYTLVAADDGKYIRVRVTGTTAAGSVDATSAATAQVITVLDGDGDGVPDASDTCPAEAGPRANGCLPSDIVGAGVPSISGVHWVGALLTASTGSWTVLHDPLVYTLSYQWQRCEDSTPASCSNIALATGSTYNTVVADYGKRLRVGVTATNADDSATQFSAISIPISQVPVNDTLPSVSGNARVGQVLTADQGAWTPADTVLTNVWLRCNSTTVGDCSVIAGETGNTYTLVAADDGKHIRLSVTGTTAAFTIYAVSNPTAVVVTDTDGDGNPNSTDVCPAEASARPNGCPLSDIVGNGVPTVSGTLNVGQAVSSTTGSWTVLHDPLGYSLSYQWQRCDTTSPASCTNIASATTSTYTLVAADYGKRVRANVTATNAHDTELQSSAISNAVSQVPASSVAPSITGSAIVNQALTAAQGTWTPADAVLTNTWLRCNDTTIGSCSVIPGQTGTTYSLVAADDGKYIRVRVTGTTSAGSVDATSAATAQVITVLDADGDGVPDASDSCPSEPSARPNGCPLSDIVGNGIPTISGTLKVSNTVSSTTGSWTVLHDPLGYALTYQWQRCDTTSTASCANIASATASTYALVAADYGKRVRVNVTATNAHDTDTQASAISNVISQVPANSVLPSITGTARVGNVLAGGTGTWTPGDASLARQWLRCTTTSIGSCSPIASATGATYTLVAADSANYIRLQVSGTAGTDTVVATSAATSEVFTDTDSDGVVDGADTCPSEAGTKPNGCLPSDIVGAGIPTIHGFLATGQTITSTPGTWNVLHDPLGYTLSYQWQRCNDATSASCSNISLATSSTYVLAAADYGKRIRLNVTATNADDIALQSSAISAAVSEVPANVTLPTAGGASKVGQTVIGSQGTWTPADATLTNVWLRCTTTSIGSCAPIAGQTGANYVLVAADDNRYIRLQVTATTTAGNSVATSAATALIVTDDDNDGVVDGSDACLGETGTKPNGCLPSDIVGAGLPSISGNLVVGETMSSTDGTWNVLHDQLGYTLTRQWQRCDDATAGSCSDIGSATSTTYALTASDLGKRVRVIVTATNADDSASQSSAISTAVIAADSPPVNNVAPAISGTTEAGGTLTASGSSSDWTPSSATLAYAWLRCTDSASEASCSAIPSADSSTYALVAADAGNYIRVRVTATANALSTEIVSAASAKVTTPAVVTPPPVTPPPAPNPATITGPANLKTLRPSKTRAVTFSRVSVYCGSKSTGNCTGEAVLTGKIGGKTKKLGALKLSNLKGGGRIIAMKLSSSAMKALNKKPIKAELAITYTSPGFAPLTYLGKVTLQKPKK